MTVVSLENLLYGEELRALQEHHRFLRDEDGITEYRSIAEVGDTECRSLLKRLSRVVESIHLGWFGGAGKLEKIWFQKTSSSSPMQFDTGATPFEPHLDTYRKRKAMIYVDDTSVENGPFFSSYRDPNLFEAIRCRVARQVESGAITAQEGWRLELQNLVTSGDFRPVVGAAGSVHVFDTNTPHFAGTPDPGKERRTVRLDYYIGHRGGRWIPTGLKGKES